LFISKLATAHGKVQNSRYWLQGAHCAPDGS
jgi:hypothetical protein